jgi:hypothetical protein
MEGEVGDLLIGACLGRLRNILLVLHSAIESRKRHLQTRL